MGRGLVALLVCAALSSLPVVPSVAAPTPDLLRVLETQVRLSPNGDGRHDHGTVHFDLAEPADVVVTVKVRQTFGRHVQGTFRLGIQPAGNHRWRWNGRVDGRVVPDGRYDVTIRARSGETEDDAVVSVGVDTEAPGGSLVITRSTVYPLASQVADHVLVEYLRGGWDPQVIVDHFNVPDLAAHFTVVGPDGRVVLRRVVRHPDTAVLEWYGRGAGGQPVPEGTYVVRVRAYDLLGNRTRLRTHVTVSHQQLRPEAWSTTVDAASATRYEYAVPYDCLGCGDFCGPLPDSRYPGGLAFGCPYWSSYAAFSSAVPFEAAPVDTYRVTAVGGPHEPGGLGTGRLLSTEVGPGDDTATTPWVPVGLTWTPYLPDRAAPVVWTFQTASENDYDIASFTVEYRHWVPVEG